MDTVTLAECLQHKDTLKKVVFLPAPLPMEEAQHWQWPGQLLQRAVPSSLPARAPAVFMPSAQAESWHTGAPSQMFEFC